MATERKTTKTTVKGTKPSPASLIYDKESVYNETIAPLVEKLTHACIVNRIPFFASFCVKNDKKSSEYVSSGVSPETLGIKIADNFFDRMLMVVNGFVTIPRDVPEDEEEMCSVRASKMISDYDGEDAE